MGRLRERDVCVSFFQNAGWSQVFRGECMVGFGVHCWQQSSARRVGVVDQSVNRREMKHRFQRLALRQ